MIILSKLECEKWACPIPTAMVGPHTHTCSCVEKCCVCIWSKKADNINRTYTQRCHADQLLDNPYTQPHSLSLIHSFNAITYLNICKVYSRFVCCECVPITTTTTKLFKYNYMHPTSTRTHKHTTIRTKNAIQ